MLHQDGGHTERMFDVGRLAILACLAFVGLDGDPKSGGDDVIRMSRCGHGEVSPGVVMCAVSRASVRVRSLMHRFVLTCGCGVRFLPRHERPMALRTRTPDGEHVRRSSFRSRGFSWVNSGREFRTLRDPAR